MREGVTQMNERVVIVGAGGIAGCWMPPLQAEQVEVVAVVDLDIERAKALIAQHALSAEPMTDLAAALKKYSPDFVLDLTVPEAHRTVTCTALRAGFPVIGEKPMAASMEQARAMVHAAEESGKLYMVSQSRRGISNHEQARLTVGAGGIGQVTILNCDFYLGAHFDGFRQEMASPLILDMAIHLFDLARFLVGADPVAVYAKEFNPHGSTYQGNAATTCVFEMDNDAIFTFCGSWTSDGCQTSWNGDWRIIGDQGTLLIKNDEAPYGQKITSSEGFERPLVDLPIAEASISITGWHVALRGMLNYLRTGAIPETECHDNIKSLAMVFAAIESSQQGCRIPITY
jgi:predicted dehydrogenase